MFTKILGMKNANKIPKMYFQNSTKGRMTQLNMSVAVKAHEIRKIFKGPSLYCQNFSHGKILSNSSTLKNLKKWKFCENS